MAFSTSHSSFAVIGHLAGTLRVLHWSTRRPSHLLEILYILLHCIIANAAGVTAGRSRTPPTLTPCVLMNTSPWSPRAALQRCRLRLTRHRRHLRCRRGRRRRLCRRHLRRCAPLVGRQLLQRHLGNGCCRTIVLTVRDFRAQLAAADVARHCWWRRSTAGGSETRQDRADTIP